jgi:hypothetical protein
MRRFRWLILSLCSLLLLPSLAAAQTPTPNPNTVLADCVAALPPDRFNPTGPDAPRIRIVSPQNGAVFYGTDRFVSVEFTVELENFDISNSSPEDENARHWHLWLNNGVWGMLYQSTAVIDIPPGTWRICASMGDADHADIGMPDGIMISIVQQTPVAPTLLPRGNETDTPTPGLDEYLPMGLTLMAMPILTAFASTSTSTPTLPPSRTSTPPPPLVSPDGSVMGLVILIGVASLGIGLVLGLKRAAL